MAQQLPKDNRCGKCGEWFHNAHVCADDIKLVCPGCDGQKEVFAFINTGEDYKKHRQGMIPCMTCGGDGWITDLHANRINEGRKLYDDRIARGETLKDAAERQGMTPTQLSAIEHGRPPSNAMSTTPNKEGPVE